MTFDHAFDLLINHEGGYVFDPRVKYVNEQSKERHSRKQRSDVFGTSDRFGNASARSIINIFSATELARIRMLGSWVRTTGLRSWTVQRALHQGSKKHAHGCTGQGEKTRRHLCGMRRKNRSKGRVGLMPAPLQTGPLRNIERCRNISFRFKVCSLRRGVSSSGFRFSSSWGQALVPKRDVLKQVVGGIGKRAIQVHFAVRQLSPRGAQQ